MVNFRYQMGYNYISLYIYIYIMCIRQCPEKSGVASVVIEKNTLLTLSWDLFHCIRTAFLSRLPLKMLKTIECELKNIQNRMQPWFFKDFSSQIRRPLLAGCHQAAEVENRILSTDLCSHWSLILSADLYSHWSLIPSCRSAVSRSADYWLLISNPRIAKPVV